MSKARQSRRLMKARRYEARVQQLIGGYWFLPSRHRRGERDPRRSNYLAEMLHQGWR